MSPGFHIAEEEGLISIQVRNAIDLADLHDLAKDMLDSDEYDAELPLLVDLRGMRLELARRAVAPFNEFIVSSFGGRQGSIAVVIDGDMSGKLAAAVFWLACAVGHTEVFDDYDHALKWLIRQEFAAGSNETPAGDTARAKSA
jgi:hypothetical protein